MGEGRWVELSLVVARGLLPHRSAELFELGALGLQEDFLEGEAPPPRQPWDTGPLPPVPKHKVLRAWFEPAAGETAREVVELWAEESRWREVGQEDWADGWRASFQRLVISPTLAVSPTWAAEAGDLVVEPGMAFGTGDHPTTRACLERVEQLATPGASCLDVGCGSGVLALVAVREGMAAWGIDIDADAVRESRENAERNGLVVRFDDTPVHRVEGRYELVVANLYAEVLSKLAPEMRRCASRDIVLAGILADRAHLVEAAFAGLEVVERAQTGDWVCLHYRVPEADAP